MKADELNQLLSKLKTHELDALASIYVFRCCNREQLVQLHYDGVSTRLVSKSLNFLEKHELVEQVTYYVKKPQTEARTAYFLTNAGIELVRNYMDLPVNVYHPKRKTIKKGYYTASELKMLPKIMNHQIHLNQFVIDFLLTHPDTPSVYFDEKFVSHFHAIRPDGMLTIGDTDFFLEMDMATESKKQLEGKWQNYRQFLNSNDYLFKERKIVMLFICCGTEKVQERVKVVKKTLSEELSDKLEKDFEIYVDGPEALVSVMEQLIKGVAMPAPFTPSELVILEKFRFDYACQAPMYLCIDDYRLQNVSVVAKLYYIEQIKKEWQRTFADIPFYYAIIGESYEQLYHDLLLYEAPLPAFVFFTTPERLERLPINRAFYRFDELGNIFDVDFMNLNKQAFVKNLLH